MQVRFLVDCLTGWTWCSMWQGRMPVDMLGTQIPEGVEQEPKKKRSYNRKPKEVVTSTDHDAALCGGNAVPTGLPPRQVRKRKENVDPESQSCGVGEALQVGAGMGVKRVRKPPAKKPEAQVQGPLEENQRPLATPKRARKSRLKKATLEEWFILPAGSYDFPDSPAPNSIGPPPPDTTPRIIGMTPFPSYLI